MNNIGMQMDENNRLNAITFNKHLRLKIHDLIVDLRSRPGSPERTLAFRALQMARHWIGEDLAILGAASPYPNGNNPKNTIVDPPADVTAKPRGVEGTSGPIGCEGVNDAVVQHAPNCGCPSCAIVTEVLNRRTVTQQVASDSF